jgi:hypothetical protein
MSGLNIFPLWIIDAVHKNQSQISSKTNDFFEKAIEIFPHFEKTFLRIPPTSDVGVLKSFNPTDVKNHYELESPIEFILLNIIELFHVQAIYQIRELGLSLFSALTEGRFYVSAITNRAMLEVVCVNYYTLRRVDSKFKKSLAYLRASTITKSPTERERILKNYYQETYEIFSQVFDANAATSLDWKQVYLEKYNIPIAAGTGGKKVHVNTAIEDLVKASKLPLSSAYETLSEFVHPNAGSKMLIVNTRRKHDPMMDALTIGDNKGNSEAALFYIDHVAEGMFYTLTLALTFFERGEKLLEVLDGLVPGKNSNVLH